MNLEELDKRLEKERKFIEDTPENRIYVLNNIDKIPSNAILLFKIFKERIDDLEARLKIQEEKP